MPGVIGPAAEWLAKHGIKATGSDTNTFDQIVRGPNSLARPAHMILLFQSLIQIIVVLNLEELTAAGIEEFFVCSYAVEVDRGNRISSATSGSGRGDVA